MALSPRPASTASRRSAVRDWRRRRAAVADMYVASRPGGRAAMEPPRVPMVRPALQVHEAAIDDERVPGDVARLAGEQEDRRVGDLPRGALAAKRDRRPAA